MKKNTCKVQDGVTALQEDRPAGVKFRGVRISPRPLYDRVPDPTSSAERAGWGAPRAGATDAPSGTLRESGDAVLHFTRIFLG